MLRKQILLHGNKNMVLPQVSSKTTARLIQLRMFKIIFTITARILARSLANLYRQEADRHMNL